MKGSFLPQRCRNFQYTQPKLSSWLKIHDRTERDHDILLLTLHRILIIQTDRKGSCLHPISFVVNLVRKWINLNYQIHIGKRNDVVRHHGSQRWPRRLTIPCVLHLMIQWHYYSNSNFLNFWKFFFLISFKTCKHSLNSINFIAPV